MLVIGNLQDDPRTADHPLAIDNTLGCYVGAPLVGPCPQMSLRRLGLKETLGVTTALLGFPAFSGRFRRTQEGCGGLVGKSSSVPEGAVNFPVAVFLAGKCPNLGRDSISCCRKIGEEFSSSVKICRKTFPSKEFRTATAFSSFLEGARFRVFGAPRYSVHGSPNPLELVV